MNALNLGNDDRVKLKGCPFCNGDAELRNCLNGYAYVACTECSAEGPIRFGDVASEAWNRRHEGTPSEFDRLCKAENNHV